MVDLAEINVEAWEIEAEIVGQTANRRASAARLKH
jgi:hypothetical protein